MVISMCWDTKALGLARACNVTWYFAENARMGGRLVLPECSQVMMMSADGIGRPDASRTVDE